MNQVLEVHNTASSESGLEWDIWNKRCYTFPTVANIFCIFKVSWQVQFVPDGSKEKNLELQLKRKSLPA